ncbi:hypothetical protein COY95_00925 [Candidatus Woesearchaeota archaeon CG_4_10_14_0_8_um_filter_47_5]|nr:MAG: hypothetical protein COY95_00925 [Candidatus Woesearchaeota archaeon CG_4_10_14_0_8_um_filter_47_5]
MRQIEKNIIASFDLVKVDIRKIQEDVSTLNRNQERIMEMLSDAKIQDAELSRRIREITEMVTQLRNGMKRSTSRPAPKRTAKTYVSSKEGTIFHAPQCPFAQNIKPKHKIIFQSKVKALNKGLKACRCVK